METWQVRRMPGITCTFISLLRTHMLCTARYICNSPSFTGAHKSTQLVYCPRKNPYNPKIQICTKKSLANSIAEWQNLNKEVNTSPNLNKLGPRKASSYALSTICGLYIPYPQKHFIGAAPDGMTIMRSIDPSRYSYDLIGYLADI